MLERTTIVIIIIIILVIIYFGPLLLNKFLDMTTRKKREDNIMKMMNDTQNKTGKPIVIFSKDKLIVIEPDGTRKELTYEPGDVITTLEKLKSGMIVGLFYLIEIVDSPQKLVDEAKRVSDNDLFVIGYEPMSFKSLQDNEIKRTLKKPFYLPKEGNIEWVPLSSFNKSFHKISSPILEIIEIVAI